MMEAVMILFLTTSSGQYVDKVAVPYPTIQSCQAARPALPDQLKVAKTCVSKAHWEGKAQDKNVPLD
jgi:hypothetical protein